MTKSEIKKRLKELDVDFGEDDSIVILRALLEENELKEEPKKIEVKVPVKRYCVKRNYMHKSVNQFGRAIPLNRKTPQKDLKLLFNEGHGQKIEYR